MVNVAGLIILLYKNHFSIPFAVYSIFYLVISNIVLKKVAYYWFNTYLSYVMTDCLNARIDSVTQKIFNHISNKCNNNVQLILSEVDSIFDTLKKYNKTMRFLLRNLVYLFRTGLCAEFVLYSMDMDAGVRAVISVPVVSSMCVIITTGLYITTITSMLNSLCCSQHYVCEINNRTGCSFEV